MFEVLDLSFVSDRAESAFIFRIIDLERKEKTNFSLVCEAKSVTLKLTMSNIAYVLIFKCPSCENEWEETHMREYAASDCKNCFSCIFGKMMVIPYKVVVSVWKIPHRSFSWISLLLRCVSQHFFFDQFTEKIVRNGIRSTWITSIWVTSIGNGINHIFAKKLIKVASSAGIEKKTIIVFFLFFLEFHPNNFILTKKYAFADTWRQMKKSEVTFQFLRPRWFFFMINIPFPN